ncbi:papain-like cysteine protease family protein [Aequorivita flava]|uniref:Papain-like cysteine protease family protein n=2 Tax=Aequorivita TaxID=153265 RepID=A0AB35YWM0_9FLAO
MKYLLIILLHSTMIVCSQSGNIFQIGDTNNYAAAVKSDRFNYHVARQESQNWCWAACIQMVLDYQGLEVGQCEIVNNAFGQGCIDRPADCYTIQNAAAGWRVNGYPIKAYMEHNPTAHSIINDLAYKYPLIVGLNIPNQNIGHAYVLTAVFFQYDNYNRKIPYKVVLRDPWPSNPSRLELDWSDFIGRINCLTHITF